MHLVRDLLDQSLRDDRGEPAGRVDDLLLVADEKGILVDAILSGGGVLADDLGVVGNACERLCRLVRRRPLRRAATPWSSVSEVAEHAITVTGTPGGVRPPAGRGVRLRATRRLPARSVDGTWLHLVDLEVCDLEPRARMRVVGILVRPRHRIAWPVSLRPRQRRAGRDWRFVPADAVRLTPTSLLVDIAFDKLAAVRETPTSTPPARKPRNTQ